MMVSGFAKAAAGAAAALIALVVGSLHVALAATGDISGPVPSTGFGLVVWGGGPIEALVSAAAARGCPLASIWVTAGGSTSGFVGYVSGAPAFVNAPFSALFPTGVPANTAMIIVCATPAVAWTSSPSPTTNSCPVTSLRAAAAARGFAIGMGGLNQSSLYMIRDPNARETLRCAATIVTDNGFYWQTVEPKQGQFNFAVGDEMLAYAQANGLEVRGHVLVWHQSLPPWLEGGTFTPEQLKAILKTHIQTIVARYRGKIRAWDVLNEAIDDKGNLRDTIWLRALGPEYVELAFRWAREADPDALLFYNDYRNEGSGAVSDRQYALVLDLRARGVPIDGVGLQMHLVSGGENVYANARAAALAAMSTNIARLGALGLAVQITEMDVSVLKLQGDKLAVQAAIYADVLRTCMAAPSCTALLTWNLDDGHTWVTGRYPGSENDAPLLFDRQLRPKPALEELRKVLAAR